MGTHVLGRRITHWLVVLCLCATMLPPGIVIAQDDGAVATDPPVSTQAVVPTDPPVETESPATDPPLVVPTEPPPTAVSTDPPATEVPFTEPEATEVVDSTAPPTEMVTVEPTETLMQSLTAEELPSAALSRAAAPGGAYVTVDGQVDTAFASRGGSQTFVVGDLLDMAGSGFPYIEASNPDPDFYRFNGWWTSNTFYVYAGRDCQGQFIRSYYEDYMQPSSGTATASMSGAVRTYSVRANQFLTVWWLEKSIDIVDTVDETWVYPIQANSNCVNVEMTVDYINLLANGSTGPITISEGDPIGLQTDQPSGVERQQWLFETDSDCVPGTPIAHGLVGETVGITLSRPPGTYWFIVESVQSGDAFYSNCVQVTVESTPASLLVEGSAGPVTFITGQTLALYAEGFTPGVSLTGLVYSGSTTCSNTAYALTSGTADGSGALDTSVTFDFVPDLSVRFVSLGPGNEVLETTNCVALWHQDTDIQLTVNGSVGPVLVDGGEIHLIATGLPQGSAAYAVLGCSGSFEPDDFGQVIGADGIFEAYLSDDLPDEFSIRVALEPPSTVSSNCVSVRLVTYLIEPVITVDGVDAPSPRESGTPFDLVGASFPPDTTVTLRSWPGTECVGDSSARAVITDSEGNVTVPLSATTAGTVSYQAESGIWTSNCLTLPVVVVTPTEVPPTELPATEVPTGPITLTANGITDPQVVAGGVRVDLAATNLGEGESYRVLWYPAGDCSGTPRVLANGQAGSGPVGAMTRYVASTVGFQLEAGDRTSNCVQVGWLAVPATETPVSPTVIPATEVPATDVPETQTPVPPTEVPVTEVPTTQVPGEPTVTPSSEEPTEPSASETPGATITATANQQGTGNDSSTPDSGASTSSVTNLPVTGSQPGDSPVGPMILLLMSGLLLLLASLLVRRQRGHR